MKHRLFAAMILSVIVVHTAAQAQEAKAKPDGWKVLNRFVGAWNTEVTDKPAKWLPDGAKRNVKESIGWTLKERFIVGREVTQADGMKALWLMTYDPKAKTFPFWFFN